MIEKSKASSLQLISLQINKNKGYSSELENVILNQQGKLFSRYEDIKKQEKVIGNIINTGIQREI
tara:strand:- start:756 stop:950 length:195 start_codon:yes stop_codon:yes gene_type:complete